MAVENTRADVKLDARHVMWELLCEAARVSKLAYRAPPHVGYPVKSSLPDAPPDFTMWQRIAAYLRGEIEEVDEGDVSPPRPSIDQVSRADAVLHLWHAYALKRKGDAPRIKKAVYLKACGVADRRVRAITGMTKQAIHAAKMEGMQDMWEALKPYTTR